MKYKCLILSFFISAHLVAQESSTSKLWYGQPADVFEEALPLGNGRIGMMVYGNVADELIHLNEESLWGGRPCDTNPTPDAPKYLPLVRELLFKEDWEGASEMLKHIQGPNCQAFLPMGDLHLSQQTPEGQVADYRRSLDVGDAVASTRFTIGNTTYMREYFVSAPAQVAVIRLTASAPKSLNYTVNASTPFEYASVSSVDTNEFVLRGKAPYDANTDGWISPLIYKGPNGEEGMRYQFRVRALVKGGKVSTNPALRIQNADEITLIISAATSFNGFDKRPDTEGKDEEKIAVDYLNAAAATPYDQLVAEHQKDYRQYYDRVKLSLDVVADDQPTDLRLKAYAQGKGDRALEELYFNFSRYLLISCSRPGGIPANLQGIWNKDQRPAWGSNYTTNINLQMNYWPAEMFNMSELTEPLIHQIRNIAVTGTDIARNFYNMDGWAMHHNSDIWAHANPVGHNVGDPKWANWSLGSPWLSQHPYEHYRFTSDEAFLRDTAYPLMKGAAEFCRDWLVERDGKFITAPSTSPENVFIDENGKAGVVTIGSAMDAEIIWDLFNNLIEASQILHTDDSLRAVWTDMRDRLRPLEIGRKGNLVEWYKDWDDEDPQHRHVSHLFALHPGREISPLTTPEYAEACRKTLEIRGDGGTGWSKAWKINFHARLFDGNHAYKMYQELLKHSTLPNLFDTHPPFQIDGNFGALSGIGEMLLQSQLGEIHLLPALPAAWASGAIKGMRARGAFEIGIAWQNGQLTHASVRSLDGNPCTLRTAVPVKVKGASAKSKFEAGYYITTFKTQKGKQYLISRQ